MPEPAVRVTIEFDADTGIDNDHGPLPPPGIIAGHVVAAMRQQARDLEGDIGYVQDWVDAFVTELNRYPGGPAWKIAEDLDPDYRRAAGAPAGVSLLTEEIADQINRANLPPEPGPAEAGAGPEWHFDEPTVWDESRRCNRPIAFTEAVLHARKDSPGYSEAVAALQQHQVIYLSEPPRPGRYAQLCLVAKSDMHIGVEAITAVAERIAAERTQDPPPLPPYVEPAQRLEDSPSSNERKSLYERVMEDPETREAYFGTTEAMLHAHEGHRGYSEIIATLDAHQVVYLHEHDDSIPRPKLYARGGIHIGVEEITAAAERIAAERPDPEPPGLEL